MNITQAPIAMDITFTAFETAVGYIRALPNEVTLYCAHVCVCTAYKIQERYQCAVILIPDELAKSRYVWGVVGNDSMFWSSGII